jgi:hypothetical protein
MINNLPDSIIVSNVDQDPIETGEIYAGNRENLFCDDKGSNPQLFKKELRFIGFFT